MNLEDTLILGDIHGNVHTVNNFLHQTGALNHIKNVILLGDVGIGFGQIGDQDVTIRNLEILHENLGITFHILLGNHDDRQCCADWFGVDVDTYGQVLSRGGLRWLTDGSQITLDDICLTCYGGATSVDQSHRTEGKDWWPTETRTNFEEVKNSIKLDPERKNILITHDISTYSLHDCLPDADIVPSFSTWEEIAAAKVHHGKISELVDLGFSSMAHAHMHRFYCVARGGVVYTGLANIDGDGQKFWLFGQELKDI